MRGVLLVWELGDTTDHRKGREILNSLKHLSGFGERKERTKGGRILRMI
jgi:hypothetical protein